MRNDMTGERAIWQIDVTRLPEDVVELIDALRPGDGVVIMRDGNPIAAISSARSATTDDAAEQSSADEDDVTIVATAMKLSVPARAALSAELGTNYIVLDMNAAPATADVLLAPPVSPQLVGKLQAMFPKARIIITEVEDYDLKVNYRGPVRRMLDAGADTYLSSTTIPRLAEQLDRTITERRQIDAGATGRLEIGPTPDHRDLPE
jgi:antitoxin (DNA-binding transcriptional repressor) of toxin-antitoxin stability system